MNKKQISEAIGKIGDRHITEMMAFREEKEELRMKKTKNKRSVWVKWGAMAASLALAVMLGLTLGKGLVQTQPPITGDGLERNYKNGIEASELAIIWPWEYKTETEKYTHLAVNGTEYYAVFRKADVEKIGDRIGSFEAKGWNDYEEGKEYTKPVEVFEIKGMSKADCVAVKSEGEYYMYATKEGRKTLAPVKQYQLIGYVTEIGDGYVMIDDTDVCMDAKDGRVFKILTDDLRVRRCLEFGGYGARVGDLVVVSFDAPITVSEDGMIDGAVKLQIGHIMGNGDIGIPE